MNTDEFLKRVTPAAKHSRLAPYWSQIKELRLRNCTLSQVCEFLKENGVVITIAGLSKYITRREQKEAGADLPNQKISTRTEHTDSPDAKRGEQSATETQTTVNRPTNNPLIVLGGNRRLGEHNPIPQSKPEFD